jgi:pimeloyl-ACP methyl ester carboxylesterase
LKTKTKSVVLVHGICTDGSVWRRVIPLLQQHGLDVTAAQLPNTTLEDDIGTVRRTLDMRTGSPQHDSSRQEDIPRDVILVGHSYAGMVISGMGKHPSVAGLVYIAALAPDNDETVSYLMAKHAAPYVMQPELDNAGFLWPPRDAFTVGLAHDAESSDHAMLWATRKSFGGVLFSSTVSDPVWKTKPSHYLVSTEDRILSPETQRFMAQRMGATMREVAASHMPQLAQPQAVADLILEAAAG